MEEIILFLLFVSCCKGFQSSAVQQLNSPASCSSNGMECEYNESNLIDSISQVHSEEECRKICEDQTECEFITYFNASANPFSNICRLFKTCDNTVTCNNCVTQNMDCYRTCGSNFVGHMDENIIDMIDNIKSELDCKRLCSETEQCFFYTYYFQDDNLYHQLCILLTEFLYPAELSDSTTTGPSDCSNGGFNWCFFDVNGKQSESLMTRIFYP